MQLQNNVHNVFAVTTHNHTKHVFLSLAFSLSLTHTHTLTHYGVCKQITEGGCLMLTLILPL